MNNSGKPSGGWLLAIGLISLSLCALLQVGTDHIQDKRIEQLQKEVAALRAAVEQRK